MSLEMIVVAALAAVTLIPLLFWLVTRRTDRPIGGSVNSPVAVADEIQKLHALLQSGAITRDEFERLKRAIVVGQQGPVQPAPAAPTVVVQERKSGGGGGCGIVIVLLLVAAGIAFFTKPDEPTVRKAIGEKLGGAFQAITGIAAALGATKEKYNDYGVFCTFTIVGMDGKERTIAYGYFGQVSVQVPRQ